MARKEINYTIPESPNNRDSGKVFHIKEMPASKAEWWAITALLAMSKNGVEIPDGALEQGMASMVKVGLEMVAKIPPQDAKPLLDEMMACVTFVPNPANPSIARPVIEDDIEEVTTRLKIRAEVFKLHVDFLSGVAASI